MGGEKEKMQEERKAKTRKKRRGRKEGVKVVEEERERRKVQSGESFGGEERPREGEKEREHSAHGVTAFSQSSALMPESRLRK